MRKDTPLAVQLPPPDRDGPAWVKVGVIAAVGFVIGIAWPRLVGVKLGPNAPGEASSAASASHAAATEPPPASVPKATASAAASAIASAAPSASTGPSTGAPQISVHAGSIISCKTSDGDSKKGKECGSLSGLDAVVIPHLKKLATCSAAEGQTGKLSFLANADFPSGRLNFEIGKSSTVGNIDGITGCLKTHFTGVTASGVAHEHAKYTVSYMTTLAPSADSANPAHVADKTSDPTPPPDNPTSTDDKKPDLAAGAEAAVGWEVALVRDVPKTGQVVARLPRGTKVKVGAVKDGWYTIKYGDGYASEGFVYRGALGR